MRDRERTKEAILAVAEKVLVEKGVRAMTLDEVAAAASVSKGGILHHFPNKNALVIGITERMLSDFDNQVAELREQDPDPPGAFSRAYLRANLRCGECSDVWLALLAECRKISGQLELLRSYSDRWQHQIEHDGLDPVVASIIRYAGEGLVSATICGMLKPSNYDDIIQYLLRLAGGKPPTVS